MPLMVLLLVASMEDEQHHSACIFPAPPERLALHFQATIDIARQTWQNNRLGPACRWFQELLLSALLPRPHHCNRQ